jgi:hypothetical protein
VISKRERGGAPTVEEHQQVHPSIMVRMCKICIGKLVKNCIWIHMLINCNGFLVLVVHCGTPCLFVIQLK